jgi:hypothetical protein
MFDVPADVWIAIAQSKPSLVIIAFDGDYKAKHGRAPRGVSCWQFRVGPSEHFPEGELVGVGEPMDYEAALALALRYAASIMARGGKFIHVYVVP